MELGLESLSDRWWSRKLKLFIKSSKVCPLDIQLRTTALKVSRHGVISDSYFPEFSPNAGKYGPDITPYLDTFHAVYLNLISTSNYQTRSANSNILPECSCRNESFQHSCCVREWNKLDNTILDAESIK